MSPYFSFVVIKKPQDDGLHPVDRVGCNDSYLHYRLFGM